MRTSKSALVGWTDYPMPGDTRNGVWRRCRIIAYDKNKYADIEVEGVGCVNFKIGYVRVAPSWSSQSMMSRHPFRIHRLPFTSSHAVESL